MVKTNKQRLIDLLAKYKLSRVEAVAVLNQRGHIVAKSTFDAWLAKPDAKKSLPTPRHAVNLLAEWCHEHKKLSRPVRK